MVANEKYCEYRFILVVHTKTRYATRCEPCLRTVRTPFRLFCFGFHEKLAHLTSCLSLVVEHETGKKSTFNNRCVELSLISSVVVFARSSRFVTWCRTKHLEEVFCHLNSESVATAKEGNVPLSYIYRLPESQMKALLWNFTFKGTANNRTHDDISRIPRFALFEFYSCVLAVFLLWLLSNFLFCFTNHVQLPSGHTSPPSVPVR